MSDLDQYRGVSVFIEQSQGKIASVAFELLGEGRKLADKLGVPLYGYLLGDQVLNLATDIIAHGADIVYVVNDPKLKDYLTGAYAQGVLQLVQKYKPEILLLGATTMGRDLGGAVATHLKTGLTADCTALDIEEGSRNLKQTRPAFGGNIMATILTRNNRPQMSTVRPRVMRAIEKDQDRKGQVITEKVNIENILARVVSFACQVKTEAPIEDAEIIVSGGAGVGGSKNFAVLKELADLLGGVIAGSRKAADAGWVPMSLQVGQTGKTVRPKIYFACGISGAIQHLVGMQTSDVIVSINKDKDAPIHKIATYPIVGDLFEVVPMFTKMFKERLK
ncbi:electron transfer flavoprotein subunit alpha/FixB family protein [Candidatus Saganbacteria bacterium]|nr:electron transfer flavoprotein subunit alpha/FixB family protein [Candidatus Saganbacteria bacterium]